MKELTDEQTKALQIYTESQHVEGGKTINELLRGQETCKEVQILDQMICNTPNVLYQACDESYVNTNIVTDNGFTIICDKAFLAATQNVIFSRDLAECPAPTILIINNCSKVPSIDVAELLDETINKHEFILPRNLKLKIIGMRKFTFKEAFEVTSLS